MSTQNITIIGGGIIGLAIGYLLAKSEIKVTIIDSNTIGSGASFGNAGHLATEQVFPFADPAILKKVPELLFNKQSPLRIDWKYLPHLTPWLMRLAINMRPDKFQYIHECLKEINGHALSTWLKYQKELHLEKVIHNDGSLLITEKVSSLKTLQRQGEKLASAGIHNSWLDNHALQEKEPALSRNQLGALFFPDTGHISDIPKVIDCLRQAIIEKQGVIIENCTITNIEQYDNGYTLYSNKTEHACEKLLIATGAFSKKITQQLTGISVPLDTERGYHYMLPHENTRLSIPVTSYDRHFIMTPMASGLRLAGTVEYAGLKAAPNMQRARMLYELALPLFKQSLHSENSSEWMGFRPCTTDSLPVIDRKNNLFLAFGHQHLGLTQAFITAEMIHSLFFNITSDINLKPYQLRRFN